METRRNLYARDVELAVAIAGLANHHVPRGFHQNLPHSLQR